MRKNALRSVLQEGRPVFGTMIQEVRTPAIAELMAEMQVDGHRANTRKGYVGTLP